MKRQSLREKTKLSKKSSPPNKVLKFPHRNLRDVPACLRRMAEQIENGDIFVDSLIIVSPKDGDWPEVFGFGEDEHLTEMHVIGWLEIAKQWFIQHCAERA